MNTASISPISLSGTDTAEHTVVHTSSELGKTSPTACVSQTAQTYIDDLCRVADDEVCFFTGMGEAAAERRVR